MIIKKYIKELEKEHQICWIINWILILKICLGFIFIITIIEFILS